jgi:hypothetical protein
MSRQIIWTTKMVEEATEKLNNGFVLSRVDNPFFEKVIGLRKDAITFMMSPEEQQEYIKCALDIHYFAGTYCYIKGEEGQPIIIPLRDYQKEILDNFFNNRFNILMASRQIGKCFSFNTKVFIEIEGNFLEIRFGKLYYLLLSKERKLTFLEKFKIKLYDIINRLDYQSERKP